MASVALPFTFDLPVIILSTNFLFWLFIIVAIIAHSLIGVLIIIVATAFVSGFLSIVIIIAHPFSSSWLLYGGTRQGQAADASETVNTGRLFKAAARINPGNDDADG